MTASRRTARLTRYAAALALGVLALLALGTTAATAASAVPANVAPAHMALGSPLASPLDKPLDNPLDPAPDGPGGSSDSAAAAAPDQAGPSGPTGPQGTTGGAFTIDFQDTTSGPSKPILVLIGLTALSLVPAILLTCTSFTKILVVLGLTRNALGLQQTPPNQVLAGLALFLSLFIMAPVLSQMNDEGVQPYLHDTKSQTQAWNDGIAPLRTFMLKQTGDEELQLLTNVADREQPANADDVPMSTLVPSYVLSELKQAFIIGFVIFIPFLVIDIVVSAALMSLGMMMMPPVMVSLPFKLLLFVLVDGWGLVITSLVSSYG